MRSVGLALSDLFSSAADGGSALLEVLPQSFLEQSLLEAEVPKDRHGVKLPMLLVLRTITLLSVFRDQSIPAVLDLTRSLVKGSNFWRGKVPHSTSIAHARDRLGWKVVRRLFRLFADWIEQGALRDPWLGRLHVVIMDGTTFLTPDSEDNEVGFGRPGSRKGPAGYPQMRCVMIVHAMSHLVLRAAFNRCRGKGSSEVKTAEAGLLDQLRPNWLLLMDRAYGSFRWLKALQERGQPFLVRLKQADVSHLKKLKSLRHGRDWLVKRPVPSSLRPRTGVTALAGIRLLKFQRKGYRPVWLLTNLLDIDLFTYEEVVELYHDRWEIEFAIREIKVELLGAKVHFRSRAADRIRQEAYGLLIAYNSVRLVMAKAARIDKVEPRALSFARCFFFATLSLFVPFSLREVAVLMASCLVKPRRSRTNKRHTKRPASKWPAKKARFHVAA